jgi:hypothetical protein
LGGHGASAHQSEVISMHAPMKAVGCLVLLAGTLGLLSCARAPATNDASAAFKRGIVDGYVRSAVKHGRDSRQATVEGNCIADVLSGRLTAVDWSELAAETTLGSQIPKRLVPVIKEASSGCLRPEAPDHALASTSVGGSASSVQPDPQDQSRVARQVRRLRVEEESRQRRAEGHLVSLPTGTCIADAVVEDHGVVTKQLSVHCSDDRIANFMRDAILASQPLEASAGSTVRLAVDINDPMPVNSP